MRVESLASGRQNHSSALAEAHCHVPFALTVSPQHNLIPIGKKAALFARRQRERPRALLSHLQQAPLRAFLRAGDGTVKLTSPGQDETS